MKHLYACLGGLLLCASLSPAIMARTATVSPVQTPRLLSTSVSVVAASENDAAGSSLTITDFDNQVKGRYSCEYYSPIVDPATGKPFGNCIEQPMIVEDYFAEQEGDVNIGYLFLQNAILKGHVDFEAGTITIPSRFATMYYEDPDDFDDPGLEIHFVTVDIQDNKYVANFDRPFVGTFQLHDGKITKIVTDDMWGYVALDENNNQVGWMEIARNSVFYLGHGEMESIKQTGETEEVEQTIIHAESDGSVARVYNLFRSGWSKPIEIAIDGTSSTATIAKQSVMVGETEALLTDGSSQDVFSGIIRDVDWDTDKRDPSEKSVVEFPALLLRDKESGTQLASHKNVRLYFKNDVTADTGSIDSIISEETETSGAAEYFSLTGMRVSANSLLPGVYIQRQGTVSRKIIIR